MLPLYWFIRGRRLATGVLQEAAMSFGLYLVGFLFLIVGLAIGAHLLHISNQWICVGVIVLAGIGIVTGVTSTRRPDPS